MYTKERRARRQLNHFVNAHDIRMPLLGLIIYGALIFAIAMKVAH